MTRPEDNIIVKTSACIWVIYNCNINQRRPKFHISINFERIIITYQIWLKFIFEIQKNAFKERKKRKKSEKLDSMLDYSEKKYGKGFVSDVKALKNVCYIFLPLPIFWALFDQRVRYRLYNILWLFDIFCILLTNETNRWKNF